MIRPIIDALSDTERRQLFYALEQGIEQKILLPDGRYIGVNLSNTDGLIERVGAWSLGSSTIKSN